jgi:hypothetical protein
MDRLKYQLEMDQKDKASRKHHHIQDSKAYYSEQVSRKKEMDELRLNEKQIKNNTSFNIKDEERQQAYKSKLLKMQEKNDKNADTLVEYNNNKDGFRNKYGNKNLYDQLRNQGSGSKLLLFIL